MERHYEHFSIDLWLTLIKSNPQFKQKRAEYFHDHFNRDKKSVQEILAIIKEVDDICNCVNECSGRNIDALEMYCMVLFRLNYDMSDITPMRLLSIYHNCQQIMQQYPPVIYGEETIPALEKIKSTGKSMSLLSNTGFIRGRELRFFLKQLDILHFFDFVIFSDEFDLSKPNKMIFEILFEMAEAPRHRILHIGDSAKADKNGAEAVGIRSFLLHGNTGLTLKDVLL